MKLKGLAITFLIFISFLIIAQFFVSNDAIYTVHLDDKLLKPSTNHFFGTDELGRDVFQRVIGGAKFTLIISLVTLIFSVVIGVPMGFIAGYFRGKTETALMSVVDIFLGIPDFMLMIALASFLSTSIWSLAFAIMLVSWMTFARVTRTIVKGSMEKSYVKMAKELRVPTYIIIKKHLLPDVLPTLLVMMSVKFGTIILYISSLSFLGLGAQPPSPEWGAMLNAGRYYINSQPMMIIGPAIFITATILLFNLLGDALRDKLLKGHE